jgi:malonyl-CoA decarboxylase
VRPLSDAAALDRHRPRGLFHLGNGARLERINWLGNNSPRGIRESFGIMVNDLYDCDTIEDNHHKAFVRGTIVRSQEVDAILKGVGVDEVDSGPNSAKRR